MSLSTRLTVAIAALVLATAGAVGFLTYRNVSAIAVPRTLARADAHVRGLADNLKNIVDGAAADLKGFRYSIGLFEIITLNDAGPDALLKRDEWRSRFARRLSAELEAKPSYSQYRIIGIADLGRELLRVDRGTPDGSVRIAPEAELQRKGDRDYFTKTLAAPKDAIVVSTIDLNQEQGAIELPRIPTIRVSTVIYSPTGQPFGILVINIDLRSAFTSIDNAAEPDATVYVVNEQGDYLAHPDADYEFGFVFGKRHRIQDDFPSLANAIATGQQQPDLLANRYGQQFGIAFASARLAGGPRISVIEATPEEKIGARATEAVRDSSLVGGSIAVLCAVVIAFLLAQTLTRPLTQMTEAVKGFAFDTPLTLPLHASGEIGVLAQAFESMAREVGEKNAALMRNVQIFESTMASMGEAVLLTDARGEVIYENAAARAILKPPRDFERPPWQEAFEAYLPDGITPLPADEWPSRRSLRGEIVDEYELMFRVLGADKLIHVMGSARPIRDAAGNQTGAVIVFRDVTEAKELERQLRQSQKLDAIGQLTGGIAHDFNNTLTVITGTIEILAEGVADRPDLYAIAKLIDQAADRGADLTKHLLAFARKQPLQPHNIDVNAMVIDAANLLRPTLGEHIEIEAKLADDADFAHIDSSQLSTALLNLAVNARDAMPSGGKLTLETCNVTLDEAYAHANAEVRPGPYVMVAVSDTGVGIPAKLIDKVFEPFFTTKEIGKGTGLGLSMVYGFVKQSNGHIKVYSEEGHGTTIKLYLPRGTAKLDLVLTPVPLAGGHETIFVVEDDDMVREFLVTQLHSLGYKTVTAASGVAALAKVDNGVAFDLLFTDVIMPGGINGRQLADEVAKRQPGMKVLYTSGYTENAIIHHGRLDAGVLLLAKPYRKADLARMLRLALGTPGIVQSSPPGSRTAATERRP
jgi:signal transduction histidine kinase/ActR/RegA family two-component response regulator/HAMP domain-containing protein